MYTSELDRVTNFSTKCKLEGPGLYTLYTYVADATNTDIHMMSVCMKKIDMIYEEDS